MKSILSAISYIHEKSVIHRDLKTANILLMDMNDYSSIKIIDFGFGAQNSVAKSSYDEHVGTLLYMSPEIAKEHEYTKSVDIWAIGIIMHYVITGGKHPFYNPKVDSSEILKKRLTAMNKTHEKVEPHSYLSWVAKNLF